MQNHPQTQVLTAADPDQDSRFPEVVGNAVVVADWVVQADFFTSVQTLQLTESFRESTLSKDQLTRDVPGLPPAKLSKLDARGIVLEGKQVQRGDVLIGKLIPGTLGEAPIEEQLLQAIFGQAGGNYRNESLEYNFLDPGEVTSVRLSGKHRCFCAQCGDVALSAKSKVCPHCRGPLTKPQRDDLEKGVFAQVDVEVSVRRPLRVGDVLEDDRSNKLVVARIVPREELPMIEGKRVAVWAASTSPLAARPTQDDFACRFAELLLKKTTLRLEDKLIARGTGPYSLISHLPLGRANAFGSGQQLTRAASQALLRAGYRNNLLELLTIKADAIEGRTRAAEALRKGEPVKPGVPETAHRLVLTLKALCLSPIFRDGEGREINLAQEQCEAVSLEVRGASASDVRRWSCGEVKKPETINYRTYRPERDGLFCERIFGPEKDWECACGKYRGMKHQGTTCDRCGVTVSAGDVRRRRMGHVELSAPVVHPCMIEPIADALSMPIDRLRQVVACRLFVVTDPGETPLTLGQFLTEGERQQRLEQYVADAFQSDTGGAAVRQLLQKTCPGRLDWVVLDTISVLPPDLRPLVLLDSGNFATSDLNDLYRRVINRTNRLKKLVELDAPETILCNEKRCLQEAVAALFDNANLARPVLGSHNRPLKSLLDHLPWILADLDEKRTDYSARGVVVPAPDLEPGTIGLPELAAHELYASFASRKDETALQVAMVEHPVLVITDDQRVSGFQAVLADGEAIRLHPRDGECLGLTFAGEQVTIHVALSKAAVDELSKPRPHRDTQSALTGLTPASLVQMAVNGTSVQLHALDRILLGLDASLLDNGI